MVERWPQELANLPTQHLNDADYSDVGLPSLSLLRFLVLVQKREMEHGFLKKKPCL